MKGFISFMLFLIINLSCGKPEYDCPATSNNRVGAICNDGTKSNSTGSGTCSSHGGVKTWRCR